MQPNRLRLTLTATLLALALGALSACGHGGSDDADENPSGATSETAPPAGAATEPEPGTDGGDALERARLLVECMRENGVPNFPDPQPDGSFNPNDFAGLELATLQQLFFDECSEFSLGRH